MQIFGDCCNLATMRQLSDQVWGWTTNPSLLRQAAVTDYEAFAKEAVATFPDHSISFEVIADDLTTMGTQARKLASFGPRVFVKIPVTLTDGTSTANLVSNLADEGIHVNVTAVFTAPQVGTFGNAIADKAECYLSIFAGRIADAGFDPAHLVRQARMECAENVRILWASAREVFNIRHARDAGADIITLSPELLTKYQLFGRDLDDYSLATVRQFYEDAQAAGLTL